MHNPSAWQSPFLFRISVLAITLLFMIKLQAFVPSWPAP
jgi:hypothetical protein